MLDEEEMYFLPKEKKGCKCVCITELYRRNRERHRFLVNEAENQQILLHLLHHLVVEFGKYTKYTKWALIYLPNLTTRWGSKCEKIADFFYIYIALWCVSMAALCCEKSIKQKQHAPQS